MDRELGLRRHPAEYGVAPVSRRLLVRSGTMNRDRAVELAPVENNDAFERRRGVLLCAQHLLDKGPREETGPGGKPNDIGIATVDRIDRTRKSPFQDRVARYGTDKIVADGAVVFLIDGQFASGWHNRHDRRQAPIIGINIVPAARDEVGEAKDIGFLGVFARAVVRSQHRPIEMVAQKASRG